MPFESVCMCACVHVCKNDYHIEVVYPYNWWLFSDTREDDHTGESRLSTLLRIARKRLPKKADLFESTLADDLDVNSPDHVLVLDHLNVDGMHAFIIICMHYYMHALLYAHTHALNCTRNHTYTRTRNHTYTRTRAHNHTSLHTPTHTLVCSNGSMHARCNERTHATMNARTHACTHAHTQTCTTARTYPHHSHACTITHTRTKRALTTVFKVYIFAYFAFSFLQNPQKTLTSGRSQRKIL